MVYYIVMVCEFSTVHLIYIYNVLPAMVLGFFFIITRFLCFLNCRLQWVPTAFIVNEIRNVHVLDIKIKWVHL